MANEEYKECITIKRKNNSVIQTGFNFDGIPENAFFSISCSMFIILIFLCLKYAAFRQYKKRKRVGFIFLLFQDLYQYISAAYLKRFGSKYVEVDPSMSFFRLIFFSFFKLTEDDILVRSGVDAAQFLFFHQVVIWLMVLETGISMFIIFPTNFQGDYGREGKSNYDYSTITNISPKSDLLWVHVLMSYVLLVYWALGIRTITLNLDIFDRRSSKTRRTLTVENIPEEYLSSEAIEEYFQDKFPDCEIEDIKLVYAYSDLITLHKELEAAECNLEICQMIQDYESRNVMVHDTCGFFTHLCKCTITSKCPNCRTEVNGSDYYRDEIKRIKRQISVELYGLFREQVRTAFVTFQTEFSKEKVRSSQSFLSEIPGTKWSKWRVSKSPPPGDVIWENLEQTKFLLAKDMFINVGVFIIAFFFTSSTIIISSLQLNVVIQTLSAKSKIISKFLTTFMVYFFSMMIPTLVIYSSQFLQFWTLSKMYQSIMKKSVIFLVLTVMVLPLLGIPTINLLVDEFAKGEFDLNCLFFPDNGAFFVDYVIVSGLFGLLFSLLRVPDMLLNVLRRIQAKSEAEVIAIRQDANGDFPFGVEYAYSLLILTMTTFLSVSCPVISLGGLLYFLVKYSVTRYRMYFVCLPSQISHRVHVLAIKFLLFSVLCKNLGFFLLVLARATAYGGERSCVVYGALAPFIIVMWVITTAFNPCHCVYTPFNLLMPIYQARQFKTVISENRVVDKSEVYQPLALQRFIPQLGKSVDSYENPVPPNIYDIQARFSRRRF